MDEKAIVNSGPGWLFEAEFTQMSQVSEGAAIPPSPDGTRNLHFKFYLTNLRVNEYKFGALSHEEKTRKLKCFLEDLLNRVHIEEFKRPGQREHKKEAYGDEPEVHGVTTWEGDDQVEKIRWTDYPVEKQDIPILDPVMGMTTTWVKDKIDGIHVDDLSKLDDRQLEWARSWLQEILDAWPNRPKD
ncbi:hypothetical protein KAR91_12365 [Candidatus Pacearchaeota archaeon]|nr:hypothetical protein [Candidatus Pacearchaeota archaeon]